jgi:hypothetical protein
MSDSLSPLPRYPKEPGSELPSRRRDWGAALWVGLAVAVTAGLGALLLWLAPAFWVFGLVPGLLPVLAVMLAVCGLVLLAVFVYAWQWSERLDR